MDRGSKIFLGLFAVLLVSGSLAVILFSQGSIIGEPGTVDCRWTNVYGEDNRTFTSYEDLNNTLEEQDINKSVFYRSEKEFRVNPDTGYIQNRLTGCGAKNLEVN